jgi:hypothetical protein
VEYRGVSRGIDLVFSGNDRQMEYTFSLAPGTRVDQIGLSFEGVERMRIEGGDPVLETASGELRHRRPLLYQLRDGRRVEIAGHFVLRSLRQASFVVADYDAQKTLVIDPILLYGAFTEVTGGDHASASVIAVGFHRPFLFSSSTGNVDTGTALPWSPYFGGTAEDNTLPDDVETTDAAHIVGSLSSDFPPAQIRT